MTDLQEQRRRPESNRFLIRQEHVPVREPDDREASCRLTDARCPPAESLQGRGGFWGVRSAAGARQNGEREAVPVAKRPRELPREPDRPVCVCGHPPVLHGDPELFGPTNTLCLVPGCYCDCYRDAHLKNKEQTG